MRIISQLKTGQLTPKRRQTKSVFASALLLLILFSYLSVTACSIQKDDEAHETVLTSSPTSSPAHTTTSTQTTTPTSTPLPSNTPTLTPFTPTSTPTPTSTAISTVTPTSTPAPPLTIRYPTMAELENYLAGLSLKEEPHGFIIEATYEDVNGDGETDLVVSDYLFVGIFIWQGDQYTASFIYQEYSWKYDPGSRVTLEDWTNDGIPEVIFDFREDTGGTGSRVTDWTRYIIHCPLAESRCEVVWHGELGSYTEHGSGIALSQAEINRIDNADKMPSFEFVTESFTINSFDFLLYAPRKGNGILVREVGEVPENFIEQYYVLDNLKIFTSTLDIFTWNGEAFELASSRVLTPVQQIDSISRLETTNETGQIATISTQFNNSADGENDICQLYVEGNVVGTIFGCKRNFTTVNWQDITNNGQEEIVVLALSGQYGAEGMWLGEECEHQHLLAYQWANEQFTEIVNATGCVVQSDLYGARLEDIDNDGQIEIVAAKGEFTDVRCFSAFPGPDEEQQNCWYELGHRNEIYAWDGSTFVSSGFLAE